MATDKLLAEWFWVDRWMRSSAFLLTMEAQGIYRAMLSQAWIRGARLPNDHEAIRRAIGATPKEWTRSWPAVERFWRVDGDSIVNDTQLDVFADSKARQESSSSRARRAAQARHKQGTSSAQAPAQAQPEQCPPSPSPTPNSEIQVHTPRAREPVALAGALPRDHIQHGWCSQRGKCVPMFLHEEFLRSIGGERKSADQRLRVWYEAREHGWPAGPIGDDPVKLWRREFAASFPSVAPVTSTPDRTSMLRTATDGFLR